MYASVETGPIVAAVFEEIGMIAVDVQNPALVVEALAAAAVMDWGDAEASIKACARLRVALRKLHDRESDE